MRSRSPLLNSTTEESIGWRPGTFTTAVVKVSPLRKMLAAALWRKSPAALFEVVASAACTRGWADA